MTSELSPLELLFLRNLWVHLLGGNISRSDCLLADPTTEFLMKSGELRYQLDPTVLAQGLEDTEQTTLWTKVNRYKGTFRPGLCPQSFGPKGSAKRGQPGHGGK